MALNAYIQQVQRLLNDQIEATWNQYDIVAYINEARQQIALEGHCIRGVPQDLYTVVNQEVYDFSAINVAPFPGTLGVFSVGTIGLLWGTFQYVLRRVSFGKYQALVRNYSNTYQNIPAVAAQVGDGLNSSIYTYPIANDVYQMLWDCYFLPIPLVDDTTYEALPVPWQTAVQYYAAFKALSTIHVGMQDGASLERMKLADRWFAYYEKFMKRSRAMSQTNYVSNWYGRT